MRWAGTDSPEGTRWSGMCPAEVAFGCFPCQLELPSHANVETRQILRGKPRYVVVHRDAPKHPHFVAQSHLHTQLIDVKNRHPERRHRNRHQTWLEHLLQNSPVVDCAAVFFFRICMTADAHPIHLNEYQPQFNQFGQNQLTPGTDMPCLLMVTMTTNGYLNE